MPVSKLSDAELVQWLALHDMIETGHQYSGGELADELDRRFGAGAMDRLAERSTRSRRDPFEIVTEAFRAPDTVAAAARGTRQPVPDHAEEEAQYLPVALAQAATAARRTAGGEQPRLSTLTAAIMAEALINAGWPARLDPQQRP